MSEAQLERLLGTASAPPLAPFGLVLHHDGSWTHEGAPIRHRRLREKFDASVVYLAEEARYVVRVGRFRGLIELEEAGFFVRDIDLERATVRLSDASGEPLDPSTLELAPIDSALLCRVKFGLAPEGLPARFTRAAQAELLAAVEERSDGSFSLRLAGTWVPFPEL